MNIDDMKLEALVPGIPAHDQAPTADDTQAELALLALWEADDLPGVEPDKSLQNIAFSLRRLDSFAGASSDDLARLADSAERIAAALERIEKAGAAWLGQA